MAERDHDWTPDILTQLVEQMRALRQEVSHHAESDETMYARIDNKLKKIEEMVDNKYVTKQEFNPIKAICYGIVTIFMGAVLTAIAALVVIGKSGSGHVGP